MRIHRSHHTTDSFSFFFDMDNGGVVSFILARTSIPWLGPQSFILQLSAYLNNVVRNVLEVLGMFLLLL